MCVCARVLVNTNICVVCVCVCWCKYVCMLINYVYTNECKLHICMCLNYIFELRRHVSPFVHTRQKLLSSINEITHTCFVCMCICVNIYVCQYTRAYRSTCVYICVHYIVCTQIQDVDLTGCTINSGEYAFMAGAASGLQMVCTKSTPCLHISIYK